jgi:hypothetical protein
VPKNVEATIIGVDPESTLGGFNPAIDHGAHGNPALPEPESDRLLLPAITRITLYANRHAATITRSNRVRPVPGGRPHISICREAPVEDVAGVWRSHAAAEYSANAVQPPGGSQRRPHRARELDARGIHRPALQGDWRVHPSTGGTQVACTVGNRAAHRDAFRVTGGRHLPRASISTSAIARDSETNETTPTYR